MSSSQLEKFRTPKGAVVFRRYLSGFIVLCLIITIIASASAGAMVSTIIYRAIAVYLILSAIGSILKRYWYSLASLREEHSRK